MKDRAFNDWFNREDYGDRDQLQRCWASARKAAFMDAVQAIRNVQESFVVNGGRSERDREQRRRQSLYIRGLDTARGAVEVAATEREK